MTDSGNSGFSGFAFFIIFITGFYFMIMGIPDFSSNGSMNTTSFDSYIESFVVGNIQWVVILSVVFGTMFTVLNSIGSTELEDELEDEQVKEDNIRPEYDRSGFWE